MPGAGSSWAPWRRLAAARDAGVAAALEHGQQLLGKPVHLFELDQPARAGERLLEPLVVEGLHQVVDGRHVEGLERVLVVRGHEHRGGHVLRADRPDHVDAGRAGHLHVEEHEVGLQRADGADRRFAVVREADDFHVFLVSQQIFEALPRQGFVIDDEDAQRLASCHASSLAVSGYAGRVQGLAERVTADAQAERVQLIALAERNDDLGNHAAVLGGPKRGDWSVP